MVSISNKITDTQALSQFENQCYAEDVLPSMSDKACLDWDSEIEERELFITLFGDYNFYINKVEKTRFPGSKKLPPCNRANLELRVHCPGSGYVTVHESLFLHSAFQNQLVAFFKCIGRWDPDNPKMNWDDLEGCFGTAVFTTHNFVGSDGREHRCNCVQYFKDPAA